MPKYHIHRLPPPAPAPPNQQGLHYTLLLPDLPETIASYEDFMAFVQDNPSIMQEIACAITTLSVPHPPPP